jgi:gamma-glutamyl-gamma-aminobutyrate hydrolase PuuD
MLGKNLKSLAQSQDRIIEYFKHTNYKIIGIMWHPEREKILKKFDKKIIKGLIR